MKTCRICNQTKIEQTEDKLRILRKNRAALEKESKV